MKNILIVLIVLLLGMALYAVNKPADYSSIQTFDDCARHFPILESFPPQCKTPDGRTFVGNREMPVPAPEKMNGGETVPQIPKATKPIPTPIPISKPSPTPKVPAEHPAVSSARHDLADFLEIEPDQIKFKAMIEKTWPDGCLGLSVGDEMCTQALVPGFEIVFMYDDSDFIYRTNLTGSNVRGAE